MGAKVPQYPPPGSKPPSTPPPPPPPRPPSGFGLIGLVGVRVRPATMLCDFRDAKVDAVSIPTCCTKCGRLYSVVPQLAKGFICLHCGGPRYDPWPFFNPDGTERR